MHTDERCISAIHAFVNNIMCMHDIPTFKVTQFPPLLNSLRKMFPGNLWLDTKPGRQAVHEDFSDGVIKATHSHRSHEFILWVCNKVSFDLE